MTLCICGCAQETTGTSKYADYERCRQRAYDNRKREKAEALGVSPRPNLTDLESGTTLRRADAPRASGEPREPGWLLLLRALDAAGDRGVFTGDIRRLGISGNPGERVRELKARGFELRFERERYPSGRGFGKRWWITSRPKEVMPNPDEHIGPAGISVRGRDRQVKSAGNASATISPGSTLACPAASVADSQPACPSQSLFDVRADTAHYRQEAA